MNQYEEFYNQQFYYYQRKYGREWQITREELIQWWEATGKAMEKFHDSRKHRFCRINSSEPWTLSNVQIETPEIKASNKRAYVRKRVREPVRMEEKPRMLNLDQWLAEVRNK